MKAYLISTGAVFGLECTRGAHLARRRGGGASTDPAVLRDHDDRCGVAVRVGGLTAGARGTLADALDGSTFCQASRPGHPASR